MVTESESSTARRARLLRLELAALATISSICSVAVIDGAGGTLTGVAPLLGISGLGLVLLRRRGLERRAPAWSAEHVGLVLAAVVAAGFAWTAGSDEWRMTAAAIAITTPNWYVAAANLLPPPPRRVSGL
jgi:hypothetical protein